MKRKLLSFFLLLCALSLYAQEKPRSGLVTDEAGIPLERVSVQIKGTTGGGFTDAAGAFKVTAKDDDVFILSMVGYNRLEVTAKNVNPTVPLKLIKSESLLTEVVVAALGMNRKRNQTSYAIQQISGEEIARIRAPNFMQGLSGKIAGLSIQQNNVLGGSTNVQLRGIRSITGDNTALFVIDGVPYNNQSGARRISGLGSNLQRLGFGGYDYGSAAADINPDDIETISVLKGAAATALYGSQGSNGVVIINTKKGKRGLGITVNTGVGVASLVRNTFPEYQNEYGAGYSQSWFNRDINGDGQPERIARVDADASYGMPFDPSLMVYQWDALDTSSPNYLKQRPWTAAAHDASHFFKPAVSTNFSVFADGGTDKGTFKVGFTRNDDRGIVENSRITKNLVNFSGTLNLSDKVTVGAMTNYSNINGKGRYGTGYDGDFGRNIMTSFRQWWQTNVDVKEQRAAYFRNRRNMTWNYKSPNTLEPYYWNNPYWSIYENYETDTRNRYFGNVHVNYKITPWLNLLGRASLDTYDELREERIAIGSTGVPTYQRTNASFLENNFDLLLNMDKDLSGKLNFKALLGYNLRKQKTQSIFAETNGGLISERVYALSNSLNALETPIEYVGRREVQGVFSGVTLSWNELLTLDGTIRRDASSTLPEGNNVYYYPSGSLGFNFSKLLTDWRWLSHGKLRANWAQVGSDAPIGIVNDVYIGEPPFGPRPQYRIATTKNNSQLRPERTNSMEAGVEINFLNNRVGIDLTYYRTRTIDQIMPVNVSRATGYSYKYLNAGTVENKGWEATLSLVPVKTPGFVWNVQANWSKNRNTVLELYGDAENFTIGSGFQGNITLNATKGRPYGMIRGRDFIYTNGRRTVGDDGMYLLTPNLNAEIGDPNPDWIGGINNHFRFRNVSFSFLVDMRKGGDIFSLDMFYGLTTGLYPETAGLNANGKPTRSPVDEGGGLILPGVTADGKPNTTYIENEYDVAFGTAATPQKAYVYDGSYVKLREAVLTYSLPQPLVSRIRVFKGLDVSLIGRNLWIIHKNMPYADPEDNLGAGNLQGYQAAAYPTTRSVTFNLKFKF
jgi:TonB-linked SusC/RagA family outer membrane protein